MRSFFVILCIYLNLVSFFVKGDSGDVPTSRRFQAGTIINNKLYVFAGRRTTVPIDFEPTADINELLYLDLSQTFNVSSPPWIRGPSKNAPKIVFHTANVGGVDNDLLVIYGGDNHTVTSPYAVFDTKSQQWSTPIFADPSQITRRHQLTGVNLDCSTILYYSGFTRNNYTSVGSTPSILTNTFFILDTKTDTWSTTSNLPFGPDYRSLHTSTLIDGKLYVIGGLLDFNSNLLASMDQIPVFDLKTGKWTQLQVTGDIPPKRKLHAAVGTWDNKIIIYGGAVRFNDFNTSFNDLYMLDPAKSTWKKITTNGDVPGVRQAHTMVLAGANLIVAFGRHEDDLNPGYPNNLLVLDITTFTWQKTYTPKQHPPKYRYRYKSR